MPWLIVLRGPMGSGKSTIAQFLRQTLQDSDGLDLDLNADGEVHRLDEVLAKENVIAEMYDGGSHTSNPKWIARFKGRSYNILSVILDANLQTCIFRVLHRPTNRNNESIIREHYKKFHEELRPIFSERAGVREIVVSTESKNPEDVRQEILDYIVKK